MFAGLATGAGIYGYVHGLPVVAIWLFLLAAAIAVLSFIDDQRGLSVTVRLLGQFAGVLLLVVGGFYLPELSLPGVIWPWPQWFAILFTVGYLVWMINLYNFMDGMDGFAAGMAMIGFGTFAILGYLVGQHEFLVLNLIIVSAVAGFLVFNFPPARIFMGDSGSSLLGLLAGGMTIWGVQMRVFSFWQAVLIFSPFIVDATATLLRRLLQSQKVWQAHKTHYYQRLVQSGWGHKKTVLSEYLLMLACGFSALAAHVMSQKWQTALALFWIIVYPVLMNSVHRIEKRAAA